MSKIYTYIESFREKLETHRNLYLKIRNLKKEKNVRLKTGNTYSNLYLILYTHKSLRNISKRKTRIYTYIESFSKKLETRRNLYLKIRNSKKKKKKYLIHS